MYLNASIENSISHLKRISPNSIEIFMLLSMFPNGITNQELFEVLNDYTDVKNCLECLIKRSMVIAPKNHKSNEIILNLLPFM